MAFDEMSRIKLDPRLAEGLIEGRIGDQAELPPGATEVAHVLEAARRAATEGDDSAMAATVAAMRAVLAPGDVASPAALPAAVRGWVRSPLPRAATACAAGLTVLFGGLAAAGALPAGAQKPVADLASHIGIQLPDATSEKPSEKPAEAATTTTSPTSTTLPTGDTTPTTLPTSETTVTAPACPPPSYEGPNGCVTPLPIPTPPTTVPPTTTTTQPPPPPTTTTTTTVPQSSNQGGARRSIDNA
jgi:hypothetical protein